MKIAAILTGLASLVAAFAAQPHATPEAAGVAMKLGVWERELPEMGRVTTGVLTVGKDSFLFMPPARWRAESDAPGVVRLTGTERSSISIRLLTDTGPKADAPKIDELREQAQARLPGALIVNEAVCHTEAESGPAFDLLWRDIRGNRVHARLAYVQIGGRLFEFCLLAPPDRFVQDLPAFAGLLTSFQVADSQLRR
jgi:hypothetical protein